MKEQILSLEHTDDLYSLRDKIARAQTGRLILMWPALEEPIRRRLDLVLLKRWARMAGSELVVVSADAEVLRLARSAHLPGYPSLTASALAGLSSQSPTSKIFQSVPPTRRPPPAPPRGAQNHPTLPPPLRIGIFLAAILSVAAVFFLLLPGAGIRAVFPSRTVSASTAMDLSFCSDLTTRLTLSDRRTTSGRILAATARAHGSIELTNHSTRVLNLSAGLRVASQDDVIFETNDGLILLPGESKLVTIRAVQPGSSANLAAGSINVVLGPLALSIKAQNPQPTSGGADTWRSAVAQADLDSLQSQLSETVREEAAASLASLAGENRMTVEKSLRVVFDPQDAPDLPVNAAADTVGLTLHATASVKVCPTDAVHSQAAEILAAHLQPDETLLSQEMILQLAENANGGIELTASGRAVRIPDRNEMALTLRGKTPAQAAAILQDRFDAVDVPAITLQPAWLPILPLFPYQIEILAEAG